MNIIIQAQIDKLMIENLFMKRLDKIDNAKINKINFYLNQDIMKKCIEKI